MKKTTLYIIITAALATLATGCHKDNNGLGMRLIGESIHSNTKASIEGTSTTWVSGESIRINGENKSIAIDEEGAYIADVTESAVYRALYPASINGSATLDGDNVTVTIPNTHLYNSDANGRQLLDIPMAGRSESGSSLYLKHLTAAIMVEITNYYGFAVLVDSIEVRSSDEGTTYQLCGATTIDLTDANMGISPNSSPTEAQKKVTMTFGDGAHALKIDQGATQRVMVPVLPVGSGNRFSITVGVHKDGNSNVKKAYPKTQRTGGSLPRARMAYANDTVGFLFTVGVGRKVIISQGNLQYQASSGTWRFAANQYDYIGNAPGNNTAAASRPEQETWIDFFGWGTSGYNNKFPYMVSGTATDYGDGENDIAETNYDWGKHNVISNGGPNKNWFTITNTEWMYLNNRITSLGPSFGYATVADKKGIIYIPDKFEDPMKNNGNGAFVGSSSTGYTKNIYSEESWAIMEANGAVFLPAAGFNNINGNGSFNIDKVGSEGRYWTSSYTNNTCASSYYFKSASTTFTTGYGTYRRMGCSVRLVQDVR